MPTRCKGCLRVLIKAEYASEQSKSRKKKIKGGAVKCRECVEAGGNCVKLAAPGYLLSGVPVEDRKAYVNGIYTKTERLLNDRPVYDGPQHVKHNEGALKAWFAESMWRFGSLENAGTSNCAVCAGSLAACPENISTSAGWGGLRCSNDGSSRAFETIKGITATALNAPELIAAKSEKVLEFNQAIEQCSPRFLLSGLPAEHEKALLLGLYERQDDLEMECGRYVYKGPNNVWAWSGHNGIKWYFGSQQNVGTNKCGINVFSSAPSPENIVTVQWDIAVGVDEWQFTDQLFTAAIPHQPAESFIGTCGLCAQCGEWRRCGKFNGELHCGEECRNQREA